MSKDDRQIQWRIKNDRPKTQNEHRYLVGRLIEEMPLQYQSQPTGTSLSAFSPFLTDEELADILVMTTEWVRAHLDEIAGGKRAGMYYRFVCGEVVRWLGSLERLLEVHEVAALMKVPPSWVYAHADEIPGVLRLGRYVRFRPAIIRPFLAGSEACQ